MQVSVQIKSKNYVIPNFLEFYTQVYRNSLNVKYFLFIKVDKGDIVEIFFIDEGTYGLELEHTPFDLTSAVHVHGHSFYVIAQERHGVLNEASDMAGYEKELPENLRKGSILYIY